MNPDVEDVVCEFQPQIRVFYNRNISIETMDANGQSATIEIPLDRAKQVAKAIKALVKEWL